MPASKLNYLLITLIALTGCSTDKVQIKDSAPSSIPVDISAIPDAVPRYEPYSKHANPKSYKVWGKRYEVMRDGKDYLEQGISSWYGTKFHGKKTANGEIYDMYGMTAAHKTLPLPSYVRVTHLKNKRSIVVRVNDRGPFHGNRIIDLSYAAAIKLGINKTGTGFVEVETIEPDQNTSSGNSTLNKASFPQELIFLQVGAFSQEANAIALKNKILALQKINYRVKRTRQKGQTVYQLQLGPIGSVTQADQMNLQLSQLGITHTHFVTEKAASQRGMLQ